MKKKSRFSKRWWKSQRFSSFCIWKLKIQMLINRSWTSFWLILMYLTESHTWKLMTQYSKKTWSSRKWKKSTFRPEIGTRKKNNYFIIVLLYGSYLSVFLCSTCTRRSLTKCWSNIPQYQNTFFKKTTNMRQYCMVLTTWILWI